MGRWVALLRGINVGGSNVIKMDALRAAFENAGHTNVATYIASGNVLFDSPVKDAEKLEAAIEAVLAKQFEYEASVMLRSPSQMNAIVKGAPRGFGKKPAEFRYDAIFLKEPPGAAELLPDIPKREGVDQVWAGDGVLYYSRVIKLASKSRVNKIVGTPMYRRMTIRNWNTTTKLLALMET